MNDSEKTTGSLALKPKPRIITIPATGQDLTRPLRVAAYARVSSDSNDQLHSYAAQTAYFAKLINSNPNWIFADIYADQGITGTSVEKRDDFLRMMEDSRSGRIDRILVKSTSRFARNTKESLEAVRELKSLGVSVYFEEQNIDTAQATGEALTAVFSALAQKESEAISERMRHSYQMRMQRGVFSTRCAPYGYRLVDNQLEVIEEEAIVIRQIFDRYLSCKIVCGHCGAICKRKVCRGTAYWVCQTHEKSAGSCLTMQTPESEITEAFLRVYFRLKRYGEEILTQLIQALQAAKTGRLLWSEDIISLNKRIADIASQERLLAQLKQQAIVDPDIFISRSNQLAEQRREAKLKKSHILRAEDDQTIQRTQELLDILEEGPDLLMTFDGALFSELVEKITIQNNNTAIFRLINGLELPEHFERRK